MKKLMLVCAVLAACSSKPAPQSPGGAEAPKSTAMTGEMEHGMMNCPSAVKGAETAVAMTASGVDITVTAKEPGAQAEIKRLAELHGQQGAMGEAPMHTGLHGGPGAIGHCPVIHEGTQVTIEPVEGGAILHVSAMAPDGAKAVQDRTTERIEALKKEGNITIH